MVPARPNKLNTVIVTQSATLLSSPVLGGLPPGPAPPGGAGDGEGLGLGAGLGLGLGEGLGLGDGLGDGDGEGLGLGLGLGDVGGLKVLVKVATRSVMLVGGSAPSRVSSTS